jgi:hypothetical protein
MKLKSFNYLICLLIILIFSPLSSEDKIDIWKNKKEVVKESSTPIENEQLTINTSQTIRTSEKIQIEESSKQINTQRIYGIFEPADYDLNLNMWSTTEAKDLRSSLKRINKINLSKASKDILEAILFSFSYPPQEMTEKELANRK